MKSTTAVSDRDDTDLTALSICNMEACPPAVLA
jgi:hypothetical protein